MVSLRSSLPVSVVAVAVPEPVLLAALCDVYVNPLTTTLTGVALTLSATSSTCARDTDPLANTICATIEPETRVVSTSETVGGELLVNLARTYSVCSVCAFPEIISTGTVDTNSS